MHVALNSSGRRVEATPTAHGTCPGCAGEVVAKCGGIVSWHWAHVAGQDCDPWAEPMTEWHREWQGEFPLEQQEVVMGPHRADVVTADGDILEFQHSSISPAEIAEREAFYGDRLFWVFDVTDAYETGRFELRPPSGSGTRWTFRWKQPRKSIAACRRPVYLDLGGRGEMLRLARIYPDAPCGGWGKYVPTPQFLVDTGAHEPHGAWK